MFLTLGLDTLTRHQRALSAPQWTMQSSRQHFCILFRVFLAKIFAHNAAILTGFHHYR